MPRAKRRSESQAPSVAEHQLGHISPTSTVGETKQRRLVTRVLASPTEWGRREHPAEQAGAQRRGLVLAE